MGQGGSGSKNEITWNRCHCVGRAEGSRPRSRTSSVRGCRGELCARTGADLHTWRTQGCRSERGSPSMRERSQDVRRHLSEAAHPANLGAKFALRSAIHRREHDHHRCACAQSMLSGSSGRISHPSLKLPPPRPGSSGPGQQHPARSSAPGRDRGVLPACCHRGRKQKRRQITRLPDCGQALTSGPL